ncbi:MULTISPECIES: hypothetical protein [unclassified Methylobacterium]|jgi:hypothetical protein|uniref:hypothetical protein n=1 Tax=unclassified Methylobacterium TaxID=2615210 RepID=UPI001A973CF2|nr:MULTISPECIES: hypothetical protein [unclassified Methylobacterium]MBO1021004.1 hypothetical protein [Methylobacterium sp. SD274]
MMNFLLGTLAGGLIAGIVTIVAVRHPEVQTKLGLHPVSSALLLPAAPPRIEPPCSLVPARPQGDQSVGNADMLFSRRRFWFVAP